jgi:hypothetical protein
VRALIRENGWEDTEEEVLSRLREANERFTVESQERKKAQEALAAQVDKAVKRKKGVPKQEEELFKLENPKKKRK